MELDEIIKFGTQIVALCGILASAWRYIIQPVLKTTQKIKATSEELSQALPVLLQLSKFYSKNGIFNLPDKLQTIHYLALLNTEKHKAFGDKLEIAWFEADANGDCIFVSKKYKELCGMTFEQIKDKGWKNAVAEEDRDKVASEWNDSVKEKREFDLAYYFQNMQTEEKTKVHTHAYPAKNENGEIIGYVGIIMPHEPDEEHQMNKSLHSIYSVN